MLLDQRLKISDKGNGMEEIITCMKQLGYPYQVNKSCLTSCATPQAKGHLFGMYDWLVDAVSVSSVLKSIILLIPNAVNPYCICLVCYKHRFRATHVQPKLWRF